MNWDGDTDKCAVGESRSIYTARLDGTLEIRGDIWKECPLDMGRGYCRRKNVRVVGGPECRNCVKNPVRGRMDTQEQAMGLAEEIEKTMSDEK